MQTQRNGCLRERGRGGDFFFRLDGRGAPVVAGGVLFMQTLLDFVFGALLHGGLMHRRCPLPWRQVRGDVSSTGVYESSLWVCTTRGRGGRRSGPSNYRGGRHGAPPPRGLAVLTAQADRGWDAERRSCRWGAIAPTGAASVGHGVRDTAAQGRAVPRALRPGEAKRSVVAGEARRRRQDAAGGALTRGAKLWPRSTARRGGDQLQAGKRADVVGVLCVRCAAWTGSSCQTG